MLNSVGILEFWSIGSKQLSSEFYFVYNHPNGRQLKYVSLSRLLANFLKYLSFRKLRCLVAKVLLMAKKRIKDFR